MSECALSSLIHIKKKMLRSEILTKRNNLSASQINRKSEQIQKILIRSRFFEDSKILGVYLPHGSEVRTQMIVEASFKSTKTIAAPKIIDSSSIRFYVLSKQKMDSLSKGKFGIWEPKETETDVSQSMDLLIVPGIAFDLHGNRLGYGMGYYDNFLRNRRRIKAIGLAFDFQIMKTRALPTTNYDMKVDNVLSETGYHSTSSD